MSATHPVNIKKKKFQSLPICTVSGFTLMCLSVVFPLVLLLPCHLTVLVSSYPVCSNVTINSRNKINISLICLFCYSYISDWIAKSWKDQTVIHLIHPFTLNNLPSVAHPPHAVPFYTITIGFILYTFTRGGTVWLCDCDTMTVAYIYCCSTGVCFPCLRVSLLCSACV